MGYHQNTQDNVYFEFYTTGMYLGIDTAFKNVHTNDFSIIRIFVSKYKVTHLYFRVYSKYTFKVYI